MIQVIIYAIIILIVIIFGFIYIKKTIDITSSIAYLIYALSILISWVLWALSYLHSQ